MTENKNSPKPSMSNDPNFLRISSQDADDSHLMARMHLLDLSKNTIDPLQNELSDENCLNDPCSTEIQVRNIDFTFKF